MHFSQQSPTNWLRHINLETGVPTEELLLKDCVAYLDQFISGHPSIRDAKSLVWFLARLSRILAVVSLE
jgi:hypothetical protein